LLSVNGILQLLLTQAGMLNKVIYAMKPKGTAMLSGLKKKAMPGNLQWTGQQNLAKGPLALHSQEKLFRQLIWRNYIGAYYALVSEIDNCIGQILNALDEAGLTEETIIIYTSDYGDFVGNHGMVEKAAAGQNIYEDILNIPLIIRYPGNKQKGKRSAELVSLIDIYPTLVDLLGLKMPELRYPLQGQSLAGLLLKGKTINREYFVSESWSQAAVITKDYKLGIMLDPTTYQKKADYREFGDQFFIRKSDPMEINNQIKNVRYKGEIEKIRGFYKEFSSRIPDTGKQELVRNSLNSPK